MFAEDAVSAAGRIGCCKAAGNGIAVVVVLVVRRKNAAAVPQTVGPAAEGTTNVASAMPVVRC